MYSITITRESQTRLLNDEQHVYLAYWFVRTVLLSSVVGFIKDHIGIYFGNYFDGERVLNHTSKEQSRVMTRIMGILKDIRIHDCFEEQRKLRILTEA